MHYNPQPKTLDELIGQSHIWDGDVVQNRTRALEQEPKLTIRKRDRIKSSPRTGLSKSWTEYQVCEGRTILSRHCTESEAERWIKSKREQVE